jgi:UDP-N-acetylmuramoyl-L-alanyl-D-glutamate--2,6-diaminopimelate ligase
MHSAVLRELFTGIPLESVRGSMDRSITSISYDSRETREGSLFVAMDGAHTDGHRFIADAVRRGAVAVLASRPVEGAPDHVTVIQARGTRALLSPLAAAFYSHPSRELRVIGVTGTDGKSSTVWFIDQLLSALGRKSGFLSTVSFKTSEAVMKNPFRQSTPEATEIHGMLREMANAGREFAVVEATSHGLASRTNRLGDVAFDAAVLTNVTHEHLEFHGTFENYRSDKANLFRALSPTPVKEIHCPRFGVVNADDPSAEYFRKCARVPVYAYSGKGGAAGAGPGTSAVDLAALEVRSDITGTSFLLARAGASATARLRIPGPFWVENSLAACLTVSRILEIDPLSLAPHVESLTSVQGRMDFVDRGQPFAVIVDYAHTPGAFQKLFPWIRAHARGRIIAVFGSAGERDREKRPLQGRAAAAFCDTIILTEEDPRGEDNLKILEQIARGCEGKVRGRDLLLVPDRSEAIKLAVSRAAPDDVVLLLGKGHEGSIIGAQGPREWDERAEAEKALLVLGYGM